LNPHPHEGARISGAAPQTVSGYLPISVDAPGVEPGFPVCRTGVLPLDDEPSVVLFAVQFLTIPHLPLVLRFESAFRVAQPPMGGTHRAADAPAALPRRFSSSSHSGPDGSRTHRTDLARVSRLQRHAGPSIKRSVRELNPVPLLTTEVCCRNTYRPSSDPGWTRTIVLLAVDQASSPLDHGIMSVTEAGVEPAKSRGSGHRPKGGRSPLCLFAYSAVAGPGVDPGTAAQRGSSRLMRPGWALAHPRSSCRPRYRTGLTGPTNLRSVPRAGWAPAAPASSSQGESRTPTPAAGTTF
jgi:hypothetical protein